MKLSEKYFAKHFDESINYVGRVMAEQDQIRKYGEIVRLEEELSAYRYFHRLRENLNEPTQALVKSWIKKLEITLREIAKKEKI